MAVLDAAAASSPDLAREVDALCEQAAERARQADAAEWAELSPTIVQFEEL
jgi:alpha-D-ribose 1-methylphosphonate 5-triphosphate synthase subunit PhnG